MKELMNELLLCDVHFVRCIKPNEEKSSTLFIQNNTLNQIRYLGVLETLKIRLFPALLRNKKPDCSNLLIIQMYCKYNEPPCPVLVAYVTRVPSH